MKSEWVYFGLMCIFHHVLERHSYVTPAINGLATRCSTSETQQQQEDKHHVACLVCGFSNVFT